MQRREKDERGLQQKDQERLREKDRGKETEGKSWNDNLKKISWKMKRESELDTCE